MDIVNLGSERASRSESAQAWTPIEALRWLVEEIEAGRRNPDKIYIATAETTPERTKHGFVAAGTKSQVEQLGMLVLHLHLRCE